MHRTQLYDAHVAAGARMVDFVGWNMPINYGSQMDEHKAVRSDAGMFDVSHMTVVDIRGPQARDFLRYLLANDVAKLAVPGKALYSCMLNESGGVIDDLIAYYMDDEWYRLVVNASIDHLNKQSRHRQMLEDGQDEDARPAGSAQAGLAAGAHRGRHHGERAQPFIGHQHRALHAKLAAGIGKLINQQSAGCSTRKRRSSSGENDANRVISRASGAENRRGPW